MISMLVVEALKSLITENDIDEHVNGKTENFAARRIDECFVDSGCTGN